MNLEIDGHTMYETTSFGVDMPYTNGSGIKQMTIQDANKVYFDNNICKKAGIYTFTAYMDGTSGTATPSMVRVLLGGTISVGLGWSGVANPGASCTYTRSFSVGDSIYVAFHGNGATFGQAHCSVTKLY